MGECSTLIGYEPALTVLGTGRGDRTALGAAIRRNVSAQSRAASDHMLKAYVLNSAELFEPKPKLLRIELFFIDRKYYQVKKYLPYSFQ